MGKEDFERFKKRVENAIERVVRVTKKEVDELNCTCLAS